MPIRLPLVLAAALAAAPWSSTALAQEAPLRIAVVDVQRVLTESEAGRQRTAQIETLREQLQQEGERLQREAVDLRTRITDLEASQNEAEAAPLRQELEQKTAELTRFSQDASRDLQQRSETVLQELEGIIMPVIEAIGAEGGYALVFRKFESGLVFAAPGVEITDQVIARIDASAGGGSP